jgi:hypothetical protein
MQRLEVIGAVRHIYVITRLKVKYAVFYDAHSHKVSLLGHLLYQIASLSDKECSTHKKNVIYPIT